MLNTSCNIILIQKNQAIKTALDTPLTNGWRSRKEEKADKNIGRTIKNYNYNTALLIAFWRTKSISLCEGRSWFKSQIIHNVDFIKSWESWAELQIKAIMHPRDHKSLSNSTFVLSTKEVELTMCPKIKHGSKEIHTSTIVKVLLKQLNSLHDMYWIP